MNYDGKKPVVLITDCTKLWSKVIYSQEFDSIMNSILLVNQMKCKTYDDIYKTIKNIKKYSITY